MQFVNSTKWSLEEHDGRLQEVRCQFVLKYDGSLFGSV
jgi:hypothetical protein